VPQPNKYILDSIPFGMEMPGRNGYAVQGGWANSNSMINGQTYPADLSINNRTNNTPPEYTAANSLSFVGEYEDGNGDEYMAYILDANNASSSTSSAGNGSNTNGGYRYGFNGKEKDNDITEGDLDFGDRIYDARIGSFRSIDRMSSKFPWQTPYCISGNNPIAFIDKNGDFKLDPDFQKSYPLLTNYINNYLKNDVSNSPELKSQLMAYSKFSEKKLMDVILTKDAGPVVYGTKNLVWGAGGLTLPKSNSSEEYPSMTQLNAKLLSQAEAILKDPHSTTEEKQAAILSVSSTLLHETIHIGTNADQSNSKPIPGDKDGMTEDVGSQFERQVWGMDIGEDSKREKLSMTDQGDENKVFPLYQQDAKKVVGIKSQTEEGKKTLPTVPSGTGNTNKPTSH